MNEGRARHGSAVLRLAVVAAAACLLVSVCAVPASGAGKAPTLLYVATNGRDNWSGRLPSPNAAGKWLSEPEGLRWWRDLLAAVAAAAHEAASRLEPVRLRAGRAAAGVVMSPDPDGVTVPWVDVLCVHNGTVALAR